MNEDFTDAIAGALTAQDFLFQHLYAMVLSRDPDPVGACQRTARELLRQFEDLPPTNAKEGNGDQHFRIRQHGLHRLERFWANVETRLQKYVESKR